MQKLTHIEYMNNTLLQHKELEGTFVMNAENNNDAKTPDAERKKKQDCVFTNFTRILISSKTLKSGMAIRIQIRNVESGIRVFSAFHKSLGS